MSGLLVVTAVGAASAVGAVSPTDAEQAAKAAAARAQMSQVIRGAEVTGGRVVPMTTVPLRDLPVMPVWKPGDPIVEVPKRREYVDPPMAPVNPTTWKQDPLLDVQRDATQESGPSRAFLPPIVNIEAQPFNGATPPDTVGEVGPNHYVHMINGAGGTAVRIYNKTGTLLAGPVSLSTFGTGVCSTGAGGDPIPVYDEMADRWLLTEFTSPVAGNVLCVYVSTTPDPTGTYHAYQFTAPNFPDYPKYAVWPDAYYIGTNEAGPSPVYALDRANMLNGAAAAPPQRFTAPSLAAFGFQILQPGDHDGATPPPAGAPGYFMRHRDDEAHNPATNDPTRDFLELWEFDVDWATPANSTFTGPLNIPITEIDSELCGFVSFQCFQQPNGQRLDPLRELVMWRLQYRNFGTHETLVGNLTTDVDGTDRGGIRWFELRKVGAGAWSLFQEGTYSPDGDSRWMGSIAMNGQGDMAVGYSVASPTQSADIRYVGRKATDPAGTMPQGEETLIAGTGSWGAERWGDYSAMSVDPADDCTFWYTHMHADGFDQWGLRLGAFRMEGCGAPPVNCGNSVLDAGEACDDGNMLAGDGCSATCQVESGFVCTDPVPGGPNVIADPSFESGTPNPSWTEFSTNFGTPLCDAGCPGVGPSDGNWYAWFGGASVPETASLSQSLTLPAGANALTFDLWVGACDSPGDVFDVRVDNNDVFSVDPCATNGGYTQQTVDVSAFADGANHTLLLESVTNATNGGVSNFFVDNLSLPVQGQASVCTPDGGGVCFAEDFDAGVSTLGDWVRFNTGALNWDWGTTDDGVCGSVNGTPGNHTGGAAEAACIDSDAAGNGVINAYLCSPQFTVGDPASELDFLYNFQIFGFTGEDAFEVLIGTAAPSPATVGGYTSLLLQTTSQGAFQSPPGVAANLPLGAFSGQQVHLCFRYGGDFDWYAQVDDISVSGCAAQPNNPPVLDPIGDQFFLIPATFSIPLSATDPDGDELTFTADVPPFCTLVDGGPGNNTAQINCTGTNPDQTVPVSILVTVTDDGTPPLTDQDVFTLVLDFDTDGDGVRDLDDNCTMVANPGQEDADGDGYGTRCDGDFNNDCVVNPIDLGIFRTLFFSANALADFNADGIVNPLDLGIFRTLFFEPVGPSSNTNVCD